LRVAWVRPAAVSSLLRKLRSRNSRNRAVLEKVNQAYWAEQVGMQILCANAWIAWGQGDREQALNLMRAAADTKYQSNSPVDCPVSFITVSS
jgi:hypothetical protein